MKKYDVEINGVTTTLLLSDEDAKARGLTSVAEKAKTPANKAKTPANKRAEAIDKAFVPKAKSED